MNVIKRMQNFINDIVYMYISSQTSISTKDLYSKFETFFCQIGDDS